MGEYRTFGRKIGDYWLSIFICCIIVAAIVFSFIEHRDDLTPEEMIAKSPACKLDGLQFDATVNAYRSAKNGDQLVNKLHEMNIEDICREALVRSKFDEGEE